MKTLFSVALFLLAFVPSLCWAGPYEHRGFFFSGGLGLGYTSFSTYKESTEGASTYDSYENGEYIGWREFEYLSDTYDEKFSGFEMPVLEYRIGKSFGNLVAVYTVMDAGLFSGDGKYHRENYTRPKYYDDDYYGWHYADTDSLVGEESAKKSVYAISGSFGFGVSVYPFRDVRHVLNGAYIGYSSGMTGIYTFSKNSDLEFGQMGVFTQFELGKDWWVSETWSAGFVVAYSFVSVIEDDFYSVYEGDRNTIKIMFRITRG